MILQEDAELYPWVFGVLIRSSGAGDFLRALADAAARADWENYPILRPVLLKMKEKYPKYSTREWLDVLTKSTKERPTK